MKREGCAKTSRELYSVPVRYTSSEASTVVKSVTGFEGVEAWSRTFRAQGGCVYPKLAKDVYAG